MKDTPLARLRRTRRLNRELARGYPAAHCELDFHSPLELLVATVLSAQCTDVRVNSVTPALFAAYPTAEDYAVATESEVEHLIRPTGFYKAKAANLIGLGRKIMTDFGGEVPKSLEDLVSLPGVGRKTAHVVRGNAFGLPGLTVDTHFGRLVRRFRLSDATDPGVIEADIAGFLDPKDWTMFSHRIIFHGRRVCHARTPACGACYLSSWCPSYGDGETDPHDATRLIKAQPEEKEHLLQLAGISAAS